MALIFLFLLYLIVSWATLVFRKWNRQTKKIHCFLTQIQREHLFPSLVLIKVETGKNRAKWGERIFPKLYDLQSGGRGVIWKPTRVANVVGKVPIVRHQTVKPNWRSWGNRPSPLIFQSVKKEWLKNPGDLWKAMCGNAQFILKCLMHIY